MVTITAAMSTRSFHGEADVKGSGHSFEARIFFGSENISAEHLINTSPDKLHLTKVTG